MIWRSELLQRLQEVRGNCKTRNQLHVRISHPLPNRFHDIRRFSAMPVLSYLHELFNAEQCQAYIHTLRWKERPLHCPRCQSHDVRPWARTTTGQDCNAIGATAADVPLMTSPIPSCTRASGRCHTGYSPPFCCASPVRPGALPGRWGSISAPVIVGAGGCGNTAISYEMERQLEGTVEADELYHTAGQKGQAKQGGKKALGRRARGRTKKREPGRGHYDKDRPAIIAWVSRQGAVVIQATRDFTVQTVQKAADRAVQAGSRLYSSSCLDGP